MLILVRNLKRYKNTENKFTFAFHWRQIVIDAKKIKKEGNKKIFMVFVNYIKLLKLKIVMEIATDVEEINNKNRNIN